MSQTYTMTELAEATATSARTIRYYIAEGLLPGSAAPGTWAGYSEEHLVRLHEILRLRAEGRTLSQIKEVINPSPTQQPDPAPDGGWVKFPVDDELHVAVRDTAPVPKKGLARPLAEVGRAAARQDVDQTNKEEDRHE
jgi:DNA-binding transcriptional MerR regulator